MIYTNKPKRTRKHHKGHALIFADKYVRQYNQRKRKSILYQNTVFRQFGSELSIVNYLHAIDATIKEFNGLYQDTINAKHALALLFIKHYLTEHNKESFLPGDIVEYYPQMHTVMGFIVSNGAKAFQMLCIDLCNFHFVNPLGHRYQPTTRLKLFCTMYERNVKTLFSA